MALDFPNAPTTGQKYPSPSVVGQPTYTWDGEKWVCDTAAIGTGPVIPSGTKMLFYQAAAPVGWTQDATHNDKVLRVVSGAGGGSGGSNNFSTVQAQTTVGGHTMTLGETPGGISSGNSAQAIQVWPNNNGSQYVPISDGSWGQMNVSPSGTTVIANSGGNRPVGGTTNLSGNNNIGVTSSNTGGAAHNHPITMDTKYVDMIIASKN
jgi:hypothetical protein